MTRTVSASEAKSKFGAVLEWVNENEGPVIVQSYGQPRAVILSFTDYQKYEERLEVMKKQAALARLRQLRHEIQARNPDMTEQEAHSLSDRFIRDVMEDMVNEGKILFEDD